MKKKLWLVYYEWKFPHLPDHEGNHVFLLGKVEIWLEIKYPTVNHIRLPHLP